MIVVSAGMERSGTRWYYNLANDLAMAAGYGDARAIREQYRLHSILTTANCNMPRLGARSLLKLEEVSRETDLFTVKTHRRPSRALRRLLAEGRFKAAYICRDLRDVVVSGLEVGRKMRAAGNTRRIFLVGPYRGFARLHTVEGGIRWALWQLIPRWDVWMRCPGVLVTRYENLLADTAGEVRRLADHLRFEVSDEQIQRIVDVYRWNSGDGAVEKPHYLNKGVIGRYKEVLSADQQLLCQRRLGRYLEKMGYPV